jgi:hypothetical protein
MTQNDEPSKIFSREQTVKSIWTGIYTKLNSHIIPEDMYPIVEGKTSKEKFDQLRRIDNMYLKHYRSDGDTPNYQDLKSLEYDIFKSIFENYLIKNKQQEDKAIHQYIPDLGEVSETHPHNDQEAILTASANPILNIAIKNQKMSLYEHGIDVVIFNEEADYYESKYYENYKYKLQDDELVHIYKIDDETEITDFETMIHQSRYPNIVNAVLINGMYYYTKCKDPDFEL